MTSTLTRNLYLKKYELNESESDRTILELVNKRDAVNNSKDKEQGETENDNKSCQCDRVRTNYFNHKFAYVKHNIQLYINHNDDACAKTVFESVKACENDDRFQKDQLSSMLEILIKDKKISCRECSIAITL